MNEELKLEQVVSNKKPISNPDALRYRHKIQIEGGITVYANDPSEETLARLKREGKNSQRAGREVQAEHRKLNREWERLNEELMSTDISDERASEIEARQVEIENRFDEITEIQERFLNESTEEMGKIVDECVVAISWKENGKEYYNREHGFDTKTVINEVGNEIMSKAILGIGEKEILKKR